MRSELQFRHGYDPDGTNPLNANLADAWRFPIVDASNEAPDDGYVNDVTFVYKDGSATDLTGQPALITSAMGLYKRIAMSRIDDTAYWAVTLRVPVGEVHRYRFVVAEQSVLDPVNPQQIQTATGEVWSRFFTEFCSQPITFEAWERLILDRIARHILPFNSQEATNFLNREASNVVAGHLYRLDMSVGVVNYIDKLIAREERQHLYTYKTCLAQVDRVLRTRNPYIQPRFMGEQMFIDLYEHLSESNPSYRSMLAADGWNLDLYSSPKFFLEVLRRHVVTGAFSHPRHGGNAGGLAWDYLTERYEFNWRRTIEKPLGNAADGYGA